MFMCLSLSLSAVVLFKCFSFATTAVRDRYVYVQIISNRKQHQDFNKKLFAAARSVMNKACLT
jgi:hypothetical protein